MTDLLSRLPHVRGAYHPAARLVRSIHHIGGLVVV